MGSVGCRNFMDLYLLMASPTHLSSKKASPEVWLRGGFCLLHYRPLRQFQGVVPLIVDCFVVDPGAWMNLWRNLVIMLIRVVPSSSGVHPPLPASGELGEKDFGVEVLVVPSILLPQRNNGRKTSLSEKILIKREDITLVSSEIRLMNINIIPPSQGFALFSRQQTKTMRRRPPQIRNVICKEESL